MKILMVASEANPFSKTGGLGDVVFALSKQLVKEGNDVTIITPFYATKALLTLETEDICTKDIPMNWRNNFATFKKAVYQGITYVFVDQGYYFKRENLYGYLDDSERFAYFQLAAFDYLKNKKFDVVHCHDWQSGMVPLLIKEKLKTKPTTIITIHNEAFVGYFEPSQMYDFYNMSDSYYYNGQVRYNGKCSTLKAGITFANKITTVSPTHRNELLTPQGGNGLENVLEFRKDDFLGIVNGIDTDEFNPWTDTIIKNKFSKKSFTVGKEENKKDLLESFHLPYSKGPVFGVVTRLTWQKGTQLVWDNAKLILDKGGYICVLGSGEKEQENSLEELRRRYPDRVGIYIGYNNDLAHKIYAGSDFFLMPSLFEPCGISQLISHRYATIPLVREVGGLADTVWGYDGHNQEKANGVRFSNLDYEGLKFAIDKAFEIYNNKPLLTTLRANCLNVDHSWKKSCKDYLDIYKILP